ncbi:306_t:CDS:2 [Acaulospora morrowiae]|uniref:306_t:CDS:1 n=1 Tax=Acaulospora morrowiae TaxID=94023 RepID=A0A9N8VBM5_9GLOM|nr:306_t:CDS:2 [Acaulospora morrowiae]
MSKVNNSLVDLVKDISLLLTYGYNYDVIVRCGRKPNEVADFKAHSAILGVRCPYFRTALSLNYATRWNGVMFVRKENIEPHIFRLLMKYFYTSIIDLDTLSLPELMKLLIACDELSLSSVVNRTQSHMIENHSKPLQQDPLNYLTKLNHCSRCSTLKTYLVDQFWRTPTSSFSSPYLNSLNKELIRELFQKQHEGLDEIEIWNRLLEWSVVQANSSLFDPSLLYSLPSGISSLYSLCYDPKNHKEFALNEFESWSEQDCELVKSHISEFINLIRWQEISLEAFNTHVSPYQKLIPASFYAELLTDYTASPDNKSQSQSIFNYHISQSSDYMIFPRNFPIRQYFDTALLSVSHFNTISAWIARKDSDYYNKKPLPYKFTLLYRASKDGFDPQVFHERCDNKGPTIMVSKLYLGGKLIGGYNPLDWKPQGQQMVEGRIGSEASKIETTATTSLSTNNTPKRYSWVTTNDSFLFSFQHLLPTTGIISRVVKSLSQKAVCYDPKSGPGFGAGLDIVVSNRYRTISTWGYSVYPEVQWFLSENHMELEDYEVFSVERDENVEICDEDEVEEREEKEEENDEKEEGEKDEEKDEEELKQERIDENCRKEGGESGKEKEKTKEEVISREDNVSRQHYEIESVYKRD